MSSLNVGKGLLRLWVVLAVCWVATAGYLKFDDLVGRGLAIKEPSSNTSEYRRMPLDELRQRFPQYNDLSDDKLTEAVHKKFDGPRRVAAAELILLPPALLLLFGFAVAWIARGFRSSATPEGS
jgi:hypothetical protein